MNKAIACFIAIATVNAVNIDSKSTCGAQCSASKNKKMPAAFQALAQVDNDLASVESQIDAEGYSALAQKDTKKVVVKATVNKKCEAEAKSAEG